jgi:hypothetical protein
MQGGFVKGAERPPSHDILAKSEILSDFALKRSTLCRPLEDRRQNRRSFASEASYLDKYR